MNYVQRHGLWVILALALLTRLSPILFEFQAGQDITEYANIAENLRAGRGFVSDIKAYWAAPEAPLGGPGLRAAPTTAHYAFTDRPLLLPALLALLRLALPPLAAGQLIGPLLYLLALALIYQTVRREVGPAAAFSAGLLLALNPSLLDLSLKPLSENTVLLAVALIVWAHFRVRSALLTGIACSVAFLARPSMVMFAGLLGVFYLAEAIRLRRPWRFLLFLIFAAVGPLWIVALNRAMGMPPATLPQAFLFKVRSFEDGLNVFHRGEIYAGALDLLRANQVEVARRIVLNGLYYLKALLGVESLGMLLALFPIAAAGLIQTQARPLRRLRWLVLFVLLDLALYVITWSTFDPARFLALPIFLAIVLIVLGTHEVLDRESLFNLSGSWRSAAVWAVLAVATVWLAFDAGRSYLAFREWALGRPWSNNIEAPWTAPGVKELLVRMNAARSGVTDPAKLPVVASNDPWLINARTHLPTAKLPWDLKGAEWTKLLDSIGANLVVLHLGQWPEEYQPNLDDLMSHLERAGWRPWFDEGQVMGWQRPVGQSPSRVKPSVNPAPLLKGAVGLAA